MQSQDGKQNRNNSVRNKNPSSGTYFERGAYTGEPLKPVQQIPSRSQVNVPRGRSNPPGRDKQ